MTPKISLRKLELVISFRRKNEERETNLYTVLRHLNQTYEDYKVWVIEADDSPKFEWTRAPGTAHQHVFIHDVRPFPKSFLYNMGALLVRGPVICFHDADVISNPRYLRFAVDEMLDASVSDFINPYQNVYDVSGDAKQEFVDSPDYSKKFDGLDVANLPPGVSLLYENSAGGIMVCRKSTYIKVGGYNPNLLGFGGEDDEMIVRARKLGHTWNSLRAPLFHLTHDSTDRTQQQATEEFKRNMQAPSRTHNMTSSEFTAYTRELCSFFDPEPVTLPL